MDNFSEDFYHTKLRQSPTTQPIEDMQAYWLTRKSTSLPRFKNKGPIRKSHTFKGLARCTLLNWALKYRVGPKLKAGPRKFEA